MLAEKTNNVLYNMVIQRKHWEGVGEERKREPWNSILWLLNLKKILLFTMVNRHNIKHATLTIVEYTELWYEVHCCAATATTHL